MGDLIKPTTAGAYENPAVSGLRTGLATSWFRYQSVVSAVVGGRDQLTEGSNDLAQRNDESCRTLCPRFDCSATRRYARTPRLPSSAIFIFRALRPCDQDSPISVWKPVYRIRAFVYHEW